jgi:hypothetical protein
MGLVAAASIAAVGTLASAGIGMYSASQSARGARAQADAMRANMPRWRDIPQVQYNPAQAGMDLSANVPYITGAGRKFTDYMTKEREKIMPGSGEQFRQGSNVLQSYLRGEVPQDVIDQTMRGTAERFGGGYSPFVQGGGSQMLPGQFARNLGMNSMQVMNMGMTASPTWQTLAQSFVADPVAVGGLATQFGQLRYSYDALNAGISATNASQGYSAGFNEAQLAGQQAGAPYYASSQMAGQAANLASGLGSAFGSIAGSYAMQNALDSGALGFGGQQQNRLAGQTAADISGNVYIPPWMSKGKPPSNTGFTAINPYKPTAGG